ncbi:hypothetical protein IFM89_034188 [Coptis chinensis]|uniref:X8 domain-containing protein n=1 Tax=Coptis chinensis TaxID=261450 RepID=A0A835LDC4_9MAGN|nr:hypothetical protein IFM89_034188 [Coptis chinensis]
MLSLLSRILLALFFSMVIIRKSDGQFEQWCIADEQTPDNILQRALDWACAQKDVDCSKIQVNQPCYLPSTVRDHASYAFNDYYQKYKHKGASCYFNSAAMTTELDPIFFGSAHVVSVVRRVPIKRSPCIEAYWTDGLNTDVAISWRENPL